MLSRRNYFLILLLFITAFGLFMSVNVGTELLTKNTASQPDYRKDPAVFEAVTAINEQMSWNSEADDVAIIAQDEENISRFTEWCGYQKRPYMVFTQFPDAEELTEYKLVLVGNFTFSDEDIPSLQTLVQEERDILFTSLPDYEILEKSTPLREFFGIRRCISKEFPLDSVHILENVYIMQSPCTMKVKSPAFMWIIFH